MDRIRLGIVGAGLIWEKSHRHKLSELSRFFEIVAFAVRSDRSYQKLGSEYPGCRVFRDYRELLRAVDVDAVAVLTPLHLNAAITIAALEANKHVLVEKPLATCLEDVYRIRALEERSSKKVLVLEQYRYDDKLNTLKRLLDQEEIGTIVSYEMVDHGMIDQGEHNAGGYGNTEWRIEPQFPLGALFDRGIHSITRLTALFSKPESVYALGSQLRSGFGQYDHIVMAFAHPHGIHGTFSFAGYLDDTNNYLFIRGTRGTISVGRTSLEVAGDRTTVLDLPDSDPGLTMWLQCAAWFSAPETPVYGATESLSDIAVLVAVDESLREGRKVLVP